MSFTQRVNVGAANVVLETFDSQVLLPAEYSATVTLPCNDQLTGAMVALKGNASFVQAASSAGSSSVYTASCAFSANNTAGNQIIVAVAVAAGIGLLNVAISDTQGNSYTQIVGPLHDLSGAQFISLFLATGIAGGANTISVTISNAGAPGIINLALHEYSGITSVDSYGSVIGGTGEYGSTGTGSYYIVSNGSVEVACTTTATSDLLFVAWGYSTGTCAGTSIVGPSGGPIIPGAWYVVYELSGSPATGSYVDRSTKLFLGEGAKHSFTLQARQRGSAEYTLVAEPWDDYEPTQFSPVFFFDQTLEGYTLVFSGILQNFTTRYVSTTGLRYYDCTAVSLECMFDTVYCDGQELYQNETCGYILTDLYHRLVPGCLVSLGNIQAGATIAQFNPQKGQKLSEIFQQLALTSEFTWGVNPQTLQLFFQAPTAQPAPFNLTSAESLWDTISVHYDGNDYRNRQGVKLSYDAFSHSMEFFVGSGQLSLTLMRPVEQVTNAWLGEFTCNTASASFSGQPNPGDTVTIGPANGTWQASHVYGLGGVIVVGGYVYHVTTAGTSGGSEPNFAAYTVTGDTVPDGSVIWTCLGASGLSAGTSTYTFVATLDNTQYGQVLIGSTLAKTVQNLADAINAAAPYGGPPYTNGKGLTISLPTWENSQCNAINVTSTGFTLQQKAAGSGWVAGLSSTGSAFSWSAAQTSGGTSPGGNFPNLSIYVEGTSTAAPGLAYTPGSNVVTLATPLDSGSNLNIEYTRADGDVIECENTAAVISLAATQESTGKYQQFTDQSQQGLISTSSAAGLQLAQQALAAYGTPPVEPEVILLQPGIFPGMVWTWALSSPLNVLNASYYVEELKAEIVPGVTYGTGLDSPAAPGAGHYRYSVKVIDVAVIGSYMDFWEHMGGAAGGGGALGGALVATSGGAQSQAGSPVPNFSDDETPSGTINGTNTSFTLANPPSPAASLLLFINGVLQIQGTDYTLSGSTITMSNAPTTGSVLNAYYRYAA